jgi:hypothetical protein
LGGDDVTIRKGVPLNKTRFERAGETITMLNEGTLLKIGIANAHALFITNANTNNGVSDRCSYGSVCDAIVRRTIKRM